MTTEHLYGFCDDCGAKKKKLHLVDGRWLCLSCLLLKVAKA